MNRQKNELMTLGCIVSEIKSTMVEKFGTSPGRMKHYRLAFNVIIRECGGAEALYMSDKVQTFVNTMWRKHKKGDVCLGRFQSIRKSAALLDEYCKTGNIEWGQLSPMKNEKHLCDAFSDVLEKYGEKIKPKLAPTTWKLRVGQATRLMTFLETKGHRDFSNVTTKDIWAHVFSISDRNISSMGNVLANLRCFSRFLYDTRISTTNYTPSLDVSVPKKRKVIPGFTIDEADRVVDAADRNTPMGKRDYAMLLLSQFTGLRGVDIINLKRLDIDWHAQTIQIIQHKTHKPLAISFEPIVGNAIAEYILDGRPDSDSPYVFLKHCSPFTKLKDVSAPNIAKKHLELAGIPHPAGTRRGFHCFRRSLGARLLEVETPIHMIGQILGQTDPDSVRSYLHAATDKLRLCAIDLSGIEVEMGGLL